MITISSGRAKAKKCQSGSHFQQWLVNGQHVQRLSPVLPLLCRRKCSDCIQYTGNVTNCGLCRGLLPLYGVPLVAAEYHSIYESSDDVTAQPNDEQHLWEEYLAGTCSSVLAVCRRFSLPAAPAEPTRISRPGFSKIPGSTVRAWMLLASS